METSNLTMVQLYQQLGKLFYAVAFIDRNVYSPKIDILKQIVKNEWVPLETSTDDFGSDSAYQIEIVFDWLKENNYHNKETLHEFKMFTKEHSRLLTPEVKKLINKTAEAIAKSFTGKNKSELILLKQIQLILSEI